MLARSAAVTVLADASKFGHRSTHLVAPLSAASLVISDHQLDAAHRRRLVDAGARVSIAPHGRVDASTGSSAE